MYHNTFRPNGTIGHGKSKRAEALRQKPSPMSDVWYYADQSGHLGPFSFRQLKETLSTVPDLPDVLVWCDKFPDWKRARDIPELWAERVPSSPSKIPDMLLEFEGKSPFLQKHKWGLFILALPLLGAAANRIGREEMGRLSRDRWISKEIKRWLSEGPPDTVINIARAARANLLFVAVTAACIAYGVYDGILSNSPLSGLIVGVLSAGLINLAMLTARKYRVKKPTAVLIAIGNISYWVGWALASYGIFLMVYRVSHGALNAGSLLPSVIFYPALGWGIRYILGR